MKTGTMPERNPFITGGPIKDPDDFFGREQVLWQIFDRIIQKQSVSLIGEHRCGNTSLLAQVTHRNVRQRHGCGDDLIFVSLNCQQRFAGLSGFYSEVLFEIGCEEPNFAFETDGGITDSRMGRCLRELQQQGKRLVLLLDDFESMTHLPLDPLRALAQHHEVSFVTSTKKGLRKCCSDGTSRPPSEFFNIFTPLRLCPFDSHEVDTFLRQMSDRSALPLEQLRPEIYDLSGGFPYFMQLACWHYFELVRHEGYGALRQSYDRVRAQFADAAREHFEHVWMTSLDEAERGAARALAMGQEVTDTNALESLTRKGYAVDGHLFSSAFAEFIVARQKRIMLEESTGRLLVDGIPVHLPPKQHAFLAYLYRRQGQVVTKNELAADVWPDEDGIGDGMIQQTISRLRKEIEPDPKHPRHILTERGRGYRFEDD